MMNETQLWFSDICAKIINFKSKSKQINSKSHRQKKEYDIVVKQYEFIRLEIDEVNSMILLKIVEMNFSII